MEPGYYLLLLYVVLTAGVAVTKGFPVLQVLLRYGKVASSPNRAPHPVTDAIARVTVPKAWFRHFYIVYAMLMWSQLFVILPKVGLGAPHFLLWLMFTVQATRRLAESLVLTNFLGSARMHVIHYLLGLSYYVGLAGCCYLGLQKDGSARAQTRRFGPAVSALCDACCLALFLGCNYSQWTHHRHLALLKKYSVPTAGMFARVACAHYRDEILLYLVAVVALAARVRFAVCDWAFAASWVFATTNLLVSALETHAYYKAKFPEYRVRWAIAEGLL